MVMYNKIYAMLTDLQAMSEQNIHAYHRSSHKRKMNHTIFERRKKRKNFSSSKHVQTNESLKQYYQTGIRKQVTAIAVLSFMYIPTDVLG